MYWTEIHIKFSSTAEVKMNRAVSSLIIHLHGMLVKHRDNFISFVFSWSLMESIPSFECHPADWKTVSASDLGFSLTVHDFVGRERVKLEQFRRKVNWGAGGWECERKGGQAVSERPSKTLKAIPTDKSLNERENRSLHWGWICDCWGRVCRQVRREVRARCCVREGHVSLASAPWKRFHWHK